MIILVIFVGQKFDNNRITTGQQWANNGQYEMRKIMQYYAGINTTLLYVVCCCA